MSDVDFLEDKTFFSKLPPKEKIPETGIEGWFYKKIPGKYVVKKIILFSVILFLFILSAIFYMLGRFNREDILKEYSLNDSVRDSQLL